METLKSYVEWKLTHCDKTAVAEAYPLTMENCKKGKKMKELTVYGNSVQDGTPTPDNPIEVQSVGEKSVNLWDNANYIQSTSTTRGLRKQLYSSNYSWIRKGETLTISATVYLSENDTRTNPRMSVHIDGIDGSVNGMSVASINVRDEEIKLTIKYTVPDIEADIKSLTIIFINYSSNTGDVWDGYVKDIQIELGDTATPYEPYGKYKIPVMQRGINLFSMSMVNATTKTINGITFTPLGDERIHVSGKAIDTSTAIDYRILKKIITPIPRGIYRAKPCKYTYSGSFFTIQFGISNGTSAININAVRSEAEVTFDNGYLNYAQIYIANEGLTREYDDIIELQLVKGNSNPPYEPYIEPTTTNIFLDEPLRKLGDYADYIDFKNKKVVRNTKEVVYKGGEIDNVFTGYAAKLGYNLYRTKNNFLNNAYTKNLDSWLSVYPEKSTHFKANTFRSSTDVRINQWTINTSYALHFTLAPETYASNGVSATAEDINNWLASQYENGTPVKFNYILAEPTEEPLNLDLPKLNAKTSIIEVDTTILPSNAYGKYIKN